MSVEPSTKCARVEPAADAALDYINGLPDIGTELVVVDAKHEIMLNLEQQLEYSQAKLARRDATIRTLKAALAAAQVELPVLFESQVTNDMSLVEKAWLGPNEEGEDNIEEADE